MPKAPLRERDSQPHRQRQRDLLSRSFAFSSSYFSHTERAAAATRPSNMRGGSRNMCRAPFRCQPLRRTAVNMS